MADAANRDAYNISLAGLMALHKTRLSGWRRQAGARTTIVKFGRAIVEILVTSPIGE